MLFATPWWHPRGGLVHENRGETHLSELRKRISGSVGVLSGLHATQGDR